MIEVKAYHDGIEIARLKFTKIGEGPFMHADYDVEIAVERLGPQRAVGLYRRRINRHPRLRENVLGLLRSALDELEDEEIRLDDHTRPQDLARRVGRLGTTIQAWSSRLHHHRPALRGGQPEQSGYDG